MRTTAFCGFWTKILTLNRWFWHGADGRKLLQLQSVCVILFIMNKCVKLPKRGRAHGSKPVTDGLTGSQNNKGAHYESSNSGWRPWHAHQRRKRLQAQADDRSGRQAHHLAHHEDLFALWHPRLRDLPGLQGLPPERVFRQLLPAHVRRDFRHGAKPYADS